MFATYSNPDAMEFRQKHNGPLNTLLLALDSAGIMLVSSRY